MSDTTHGADAAFRRWGHAAEREAQRRGRAVDDLFPEVVAPVALHDGDQRFTTRETDAWARRIAGVTGWDLDVAACEESHLAARFFTKADDGLTQRWRGRVWCNPPFSDIAPWVLRAWQLISDCEVIAMLLPGSRTEQLWWQELVESARDGRRVPRGHRLSLVARTAKLTTHFLPGRTRFGHPGNPEGVGVGSPPFGCVLLVWRRA
jgi:phage N-6-adenine-methyltransferase